MPDNAINPYRVTELTNSEAATIKATDYSVKSQRARQVMVKNSFDMPGVQGYFYEYPLSADTQLAAGPGTAPGTD